MKNNCFVLYKHLKDGTVVDIPLSNFVAQIDAEETIDDGIDKRKTFLVSGALHNGRILPTARVLAEQFNSMMWVPVHWGASVIPAAGMGRKDHLRAACQEYSGEVPSRINYDLRS